MGNKVSLRSYFSDISSAVDVSWRQQSGPSVKLNANNENLNQLVLFNAPNVVSDTVISLQATITTEDGLTLTDDVAILVEATSNITANSYFEERVATVKPYNNASQYADTLVNCVYSNNLTSSCTLAELPLLANDADLPTIDQVMDRVVVSHPWMAENFKAFLNAEDNFNDFKQLLRATTAVVISYDVRPSFYWAATGAIYLDPDDLWLTPLERASINEAPDYRSAFGGELQFELPWRYVKDNQYAFDYYEISEQRSRTVADLRHPLGYLLYHELAHANDFFPSTKWSTLSNEQRILDAALSTNTSSDSLSVSLPLQSQVMADLANVRYAGATATAAQQAYLPDDIELEYVPDSATHFYSYFTSREDFAMLFEELMMHLRYKVYRDVAITNNPQHENDNSGNYFVTWGMRGRISEPQLKQRADYVTRRVLPELNIDAALSSLPDAIPFKSGLTWADNLNLSNEVGNNRHKLTLPSKPESIRPVNTHLPYYIKPLPKH